MGCLVLDFFKSLVGVGVKKNMTSNKKNSPFDLLVAIASRSIDTAKGLPAQRDIKPHWSGVGFRLKGVNVVAPMGEIAELLRSPSTTLLPGVQNWVRGVSNVRGRLLPVFDLEGFFGGRLSGSRSERRILTLDVGELYCGLLIEASLGMQHFPVDQYTDALPAEAPVELLPFLKGHFQIGTETWFVFSPMGLTEDERFMNVSLIA